MAKVVIAIHGLRNKPPKELLQEWGQMAMKEGLKNIGSDVELPEFELVYWADILYDKPLSPKEENPESPYFLDEVYTPDFSELMSVPHKFRLKAVKILKKIIYKLFLKEDYKLRYPFLAKNFIHNNFRDLEVYFAENCEKSESVDCIAKKQINKRLIDVLKKHHDKQVFLIAHSMGSIIAFDVLSFIAKETKINTFVTIGSPLGAPFVTSRIAKMSKVKGQEYIKLQTPEAVYKNWFNFSDIMDNVAFDHILADDFSENSKGVKVIDQLVTNTYKMDGISNPHKSYGYLRTPEFIRRLVEFLEH